jgi:o-succinylbenzoate synthase
LKEPYQLSYGPVTVLDSIFCRIELSTGAIGWGESTPLPGYSECDADAVWSVCREQRATALNRPATGACFTPPDGDWFLTTAMETALEQALTPVDAIGAAVPLVGLVQGDSDDDAVANLRRKREQGYREFKGKIGVYAVDAEAARIRAVQSAMQPGEWIRFDANQALDLPAARRLAEVCDPERVRFIEQPLATECWTETAELVKSSPVPIALDESIATPADIGRAATVSRVGYVKMKWMKQGCAAGLASALEAARAAGLKVILGNGVSTACNNRQEAIFWHRHLRAEGLAGEMNGYLKTGREPRGLAFADGCAVVTAADPAELPFEAADLIGSVGYDS